MQYFISTPNLLDEYNFIVMPDGHNIIPEKNETLIRINRSAANNIFKMLADHLTIDTVLENWLFGPYDIYYYNERYQLLKKLFKKFINRILTMDDILNRI